MPLYRITKSDFSRIDWPAVKKHVHSKREFIESELAGLISLPGWQALINPENMLRENVTICQLWIDPDDYKRQHSHRQRRYRSYDCPCQREVVENPKRFNRLTKSERQAIFDAFRPLRAPWINLKSVWIKEQSHNGLVTLHFKVNDYEPFLLD